MKEIMQQLIEIINKALPAVNTEKVTMDSDLRTDLAIDSFNMILLAITIEEHFNIKLDEHFTPKSVRDVCEYISGTV